jgi:hypothetical protein
MPTPGPEIPFRELVECLDAKGNKIKVGAGATRGGRVVLLYPSGHVPVLNQQQATELVDKLRRVIQDAATRAG